MLDAATDASAVPESRSRPGRLDHRHEVGQPVEVRQHADVGLQQEQPHQAGHGHRRGDRRREDEPEDRQAAQVLVGEHGQGDAERQPDRHGQQGELDGDPEGVDELVAAGGVDVLVPAVGDAVVALGVAAQVAEPDRLHERVDDEHAEDHRRRGDHQQPGRQVAPASPCRRRHDPTVGHRPRRRCSHPSTGSRSLRAGPSPPHSDARTPAHDRLDSPSWTRISTPSPATWPPSRWRSTRLAAGTYEHGDDDAGADRGTARLVNRGRAVAVAAGGVGLGALAAAAGRKASTKLSWRSRRMWRLTARNATRFAGTRARRIVTPAERRAELDTQFAIRTAEDVAQELGEMKGVLMKVGQLVSFIAEGLPDEAQQALAVLQADAAPMAPTLAAEVVETRARRPARAGLPALGRPPRRRGQHRPGPPGRDDRPPRRRRQGAVPRRQRGHRGGPRRRRGDVLGVLGARPQRPRRPGSRRRAAGPDARGARLPPRGRATSPSSPATSPATRGSASRRSCPSCRSRAC